MSLYYGKLNGVYGFFDSTLVTVPDGSVEITDALHTQLLDAQSKGAALSISGTSVVASDYKGNVIDLATMKATDNFDQPASLASQAASVLVTARAYVMNNFYLLAETPTAEWVTYQKALIAISNGTDTTSTVLPTSPLDAASTTTATTTDSAATTSGSTTTATTL